MFLLLSLGFGHVSPSTQIHFPRARASHSYSHSYSRASYSYLFHITYHILFLISILFGYHHLISSSSHHHLISSSLQYPPISLPPPLPGVRGVQETYGENIVLPNFARSERGVKPPPGMGYIISIPPPGPPLSHPKTLYYSVDYYTIIQCFPVHRQNHSPSFISQISLPFIDRLFLFIW